MSPGQTQLSAIAQVFYSNRIIPPHFLVRDVSADSPGARALIQPGDVILTIDDEPFAAAEDIETYLTTLRGTAATVIVLRDGRERALIYANEVADVDTLQIPVPKYGQASGIGVRIHGQDEPLVVAVWNESPADRAGIRPGDRLVAVNGLELEGTNAFVAAIASHAADERFDITLRRDDDEYGITIEPERWTLAFDAEPEYLVGWSEQQTLSRCRSASAVDYVLAPDSNDVELLSLRTQIENLQAELKTLREELSRTNALLTEIAASAD